MCALMYHKISYGFSYDWQLRLFTDTVYNTSLAP